MLRVLINSVTCTVSFLCLHSKQKQKIESMQISWCHMDNPASNKHTQPFYCSSGICPGPPGWAGSRKVKPGRLKPIWIYWSKRQWVAVVSAGLHASLHLIPDNHANIPPLSFFAGRMPFLLPNQQRQSTEGSNKVAYNWSASHNKLIPGIAVLLSQVCMPV